MANPNSANPVTDRDRLITRPDDAPLPAPLDPAGPRARGYPADPKPGPQNSPGNPSGGSDSEDLGRSA